MIMKEKVIVDLQWAVQDGNEQHVSHTRTIFLILVAV